jgi:hypothetical protein
MPRPSKGARLYFDRLRKGWIVRDGAVFIRTNTDDYGAAKRALASYLQRSPNATAYQPRGTGFVYFVSADVPDYPVKIGFTERIEGMRFQSLQTGNPHPLCLLAYFDGTHQDESGLHLAFKGDRMCGEWFRRSPELMQIVNDLAEARKEAA